MKDYPENPRPRKEDFEVLYFYSQGKVVGKVASPASATATERGATAMVAVMRHEHPNAVTERVFDEPAFKAAMRQHSETAAKNREEFTLDLFADNSVPDNEFTRKLFAMAFENRKGEGWRSIMDEFNELAPLWTLAVKVLK